MEEHIKEPYIPSKLSACCNAETRIDKGGKGYSNFFGIYSTTEDSLICTKCGKYTYYKIIEKEK